MHRTRRTASRNQPRRRWERRSADLGEAASFGPQVSAALARAHRLQGNATGAEAAARSALADEPNLLFAPPYDDASLPNTAVFFLVLRALQEMQPLPRLDFLDPKYSVRSSPIPIATAEEMHLILAEAALARDDLAAARTGLANAISIAGTRGTVSFDENDERRNADLSIRPRDSEIMIRADTAGPYRAGLVVDRPADDLDVPHISATSLDADSIAGLSSADELWHALWLARQEIMLLEGRRLADLGIQLPMMQREIDLNPNIDEGDPGTVVIVPAYIPRSPRYAMDIYTPVEIYDGTGLDAELLETEVTMHADMKPGAGRERGFRPSGSRSRTERCDPVSCREGRGGAPLGNGCRSVGSGEEAAAARAAGPAYRCDRLRRASRDGHVPGRGVPGAQPGRGGGHLR